MCTYKKVVWDTCESWWFFMLYVVLIPIASTYHSIKRCPAGNWYKIFRIDVHRIDLDIAIDLGLGPELHLQLPFPSRSNGRRVLIKESNAAGWKPRVMFGKLHIGEKLLRRRQQSRRIEWLVKGHGLLEGDSTWEREEAIRHVSHWQRATSTGLSRQPMRSQVRGDLRPPSTSSVVPHVPGCAGVTQPNAH